VEFLYKILWQYYYVSCVTFLNKAISCNEVIIIIKRKVNYNNYCCGCDAIDFV